MRVRLSLTLLLLVSLLPVVAHAQFIYITNNGTITITGYTGTNADVVIPTIINGLPVTSIGVGAFWYSDSLTRVNVFMAESARRATHPVLELVIATELVPDLNRAMQEVCSLPQPDHHAPAAEAEGTCSQLANRS